MNTIDFTDDIRVKNVEKFTEHFMLTRCGFFLLCLASIFRRTSDMKNSVSIKKETKLMAWKWRQKCFFAASVFPYRCPVPRKEFVKEPYS